MDQEPRHLRRIRVETIHGTVEGAMASGPTLRTLDELNFTAKPFLRLEDPRLEGTTWAFEAGPLAVSKACVLFVIEIGCPPALAASRPAGARFTRAALRIRVGAFDVEGFVHVPPGGSPVSRLDQGTPFLGMTSVSVVGPGAHFASGFLALNRSHIVAAQPVEPGAPVGAADIPVSFEVAG